MITPLSEQFLIPCCDIDEAIAAVREVGFRLELIFPADSPSTAVISKGGCFVRLERSSRGFSPESIAALIDSEDPESRLSEKRFTKRPLNVNQSAPRTERQLVFSRKNELSSWEPGRAGMLYRDLIPGRLGGSFIGSHISIPCGGLVPDYVHHHEVKFQMIFCRKGWVKVVYEDQGAPFVLNAGDCVLQPPQIRHRVLECSPNLEVVELGSPAIHSTFAEHTMDLPNERLDMGRVFESQKFARFVYDATEWKGFKGFFSKDTGIGAATDGVADVRVIRNDVFSSREFTHSFNFNFWYVLKGEIKIDGFDPLHEDDCVVTPADETFTVTFSDECEFLEVSHL